MYCTATVIAKVQSEKPFRVVAAIFENHPFDVLLQQVVANSQHENLVDSHISHAEMLGLIRDERDTKFFKHRVDFRDMNTINKCLNNQREQHMVKEIKTSDGCGYPT